MKLNFKYIIVLASLLILTSVNTRADIPGNVFGVELGQDVFLLSSIEKFGAMYMNFKIAPDNPMAPFDLYSIKANNNFQVEGVYARAEVSSKECQNELRKTARQIEIDLGVIFYEVIKKGKISYISENDTKVLALSCHRYRKYKRNSLNDIVLALVSKEKLPKSVKVDKVKSDRMFKLIRQREIYKREIMLVSKNDFSGAWSTDCADNKSGIVISRLRDGFYHFLICSSWKCINAPRISSNDVEIVDIKNLRISGRNYKLCETLDK